MPIPRTESAKRTLIRGAMKSAPSRFPKGSRQRAARDTLARKLQSQGREKSSSYAIATAIIKGTVRRKGRRR